MKKARRQIRVRATRHGIREVLKRIRKSEEKRVSKPVQKVEVHAKREVYISQVDEPDVSAHLTNLSLRHSGGRPAWFDLEPMQLEGRTRQCRKIYWKIVEAQLRPKKQFLALVAGAGMGKTSFLAELHALIEHSSHSFLTLAPGCAKKVPFHALKSILEQRFYVSGDVPYECIERFVRGAVCLLIDGVEALSIIDAVLKLWRPSNEKKDGIKVAPVVVPPPLVTRISSIEEILSAHKAELSEKASELDMSSVKESVIIEAGDVDDNSEEATVVVPVSREHLPDDKTSEEIGSLLRELEKPLGKLLNAEVKRNSLVVMIDDLEMQDVESIELLSRLFNYLPEDVPLTFLVAMSDKSLAPAEMQGCPVEYIEISALSDRDLAQLTHQALMKLSETREKLIVPKDICRLIAQKSYGSPKRAMDLTLKHFNPDCIIHWNEAMDQLCREPLPGCLGQNLIRRYRECPESERVVLQVASILNAPFTASTIECLISSCPELKGVGSFSSAALLKSLREGGFLERAEAVFGPKTLCYTFKHECERLLISSSVGEQTRRSIFCAAAQWYSVNHANGEFDEMTGDLWRNYHYMHEACRFYERAAYRAMNQSQLLKSWSLFRKLLKSLPEGNVSSQIKYSLDGARVAFLTGQIDEAFRLCRAACHHATQISAYVQAAQACIQIARMMTELGTVRHISRYIKRARVFLERDADPQTESMLFGVLAERDIYLCHFEDARRHLKKARGYLSGLKVSEEDNLYFEWIEAEIEMHHGDCQKASKRLNDIIQASEKLGSQRMRAVAFRSLGHLEELKGNLSGALDAWNIGLGIVQEMNDSVIHANLLADIADGALVLSACRTARAATEECLCLAQQTHNKALIAHCLANTAYLQYLNGQPDKALRTLRKAHRSAIALRCVNLWSRTLCLFALLCSTSTCRVYDLERARKIFTSLERVYEYHGMVLAKAQHYVLEAGFYMKQNERMAAVNTYRKALSLYVQSGLDKPAEKVQVQIDELLSEMKA